MTKNSGASPQDNQQQDHEPHDQRDPRHALNSLNKSLDKATRMVTQGLVKGFGNERWQSLTIPLLAIFLSLLTISVVILIFGNNPFDVFRGLLAGAGWWPKENYGGGQSQLTDLVGLATTLTPLLFGALGVVVALRAGLFNIGVAGQMILAAFLATVLVGYSDMTAWLARPLVFLIAIAVGALAGALIGFLKYRFNIHEVVSSIMLNNIFMLTVSYFITSSHQDPVSRNMRAASADARLLTEPVQLGEASARLPVGFLLALIMAFLLWFFLTKTKQGFEMTAVGKSPKAAQYAGIKIGRTVIVAMAISGAMGGLAGVTHYMASVPSIAPGVLPGVGFDAIAVAFLGNAHPLGAILASTLIATLVSGATYMSSIVGVRQEIAALITGMILLFTACGGYLRSWLDVKKRSLADANANTDDNATKGGDDA
ncbi:MAG: ABC transporter permease [Coriobacteriia bacterium]|nr:ABC transporter permease [Coriobacteriia bacterium]MCL2745918.1 ABC transporter permease [Coriobacteriia bacterium]MCL2870858.1 ABC transporter permease [Coriobacteriia bacterium]